MVVAAARTTAHKPFRTANLVGLSEPRVVIVLCGKEASQDEFFFTFNSLVEQNKQIVLSSEKPPSESTKRTIAPR